MGNKEKIDLSIIIPVYNSEKTIRRCLNSILVQDIHNFECIIIDDGSIDNSLSICKEYASKHSEIEVIHIKNGGASNARNVGLEYARGEYITFVDSDDILEKGAYKHALELAYTKNLDVICFGMQKETDGELKPVSFDHSDIINDFIQYKVYSHAVVNKLIRRNIIEEHGIRFNTKITICEDMLFAFECVSMAAKIEYIDEKYYIYCENMASISHNMEDNRIKDYEEVADNLFLFCKKTGLAEKYKKYIDYRYFEAALQYLIDERNYNPPKFRKIGKRIKVWHYSNKPFLSIITLFSSFNIDVFSLIYVKLRSRHYENK